MGAAWNHRGLRRDEGVEGAFMDIDPMDLAGDGDDEPSSTDDSAAREKHKSRLNTWVAVTVALLATFLGVCNVKDDNIVQGMQQAQADKIDHWSFYQARNIREEVASATAAQFRLQAQTASGATRQAYMTQAERYRKLA